MANLLVDPSQRSAIMALIRSKNTTPEVLVFRELRSRGVYFQRHYAKAPGSPDIARPRKKLAVFVDGDFWHGRELERIVKKHGPDSPWALKLQGNVARDIERERSLRAQGWDVLRVWESDIRRVRTRLTTIDRIEEFLKSRD
jgi:DNA mismatch endonuclease (patch repair protein)